MNIYQHKRRPRDAELFALLNKETLAYIHCSANTTQPYYAPVLSNVDTNLLFQKYLTCSVRIEDTSFLEWLRWYKTDGEVARPWARPVGGLRAVCMRFNSIFNLRYFEQVWLCFTPMRAVRLPDNASKVPSQYAGFVALMHFQEELGQACRLDFTNDAGVIAFLHQECVSKRHRKNAAAYINMLTKFTGALVKGDLFVLPSAATTLHLPNFWHSSQRLFIDEVRVPLCMICLLHIK